MCLTLRSDFSVCLHITCCTAETLTTMSCVQPFVKSEAEVDGWTTRPVRILAGSNFESVVRRSGRYVIVLFCT